VAFDAVVLLSGGLDSYTAAAMVQTQGFTLHALSVRYGQRHAIEMLAQSERNGCAVGAAMAVMLDWAAIRRVLDSAARRFGVEPPHFAAADAAPLAAVADAFADSPGIQRALHFGAEQIMVQHHGLWDLLEARQQARAG